MALALFSAGDGASSAHISEVVVEIVTSTWQECNEWCKFCLQTLHPIANLNYSLGAMPVLALHLALQLWCPAHALFCCFAALPFYSQAHLIGVHPLQKRYSYSTHRTRSTVYVYASVCK